MVDPSLSATDTPLSAKPNEVIQVPNRVGTSALAAIDNAGAVDPPRPPPGIGDPAPAGSVAGHPELAGTVAGVGAAEVERRDLTQAQMEGIVRAEVADREAAALGYERAGQLEEAERLRGEANVLTSFLDAT